MATITICSDFGAPQKVCYCFHSFLSICHEVMGPDVMIIVFLPRGVLISWLQSPSAVTLELKKTKSVTVSTLSPSICHEVMGSDAMILVFWMLSFQPALSLSSFTLIKRLLSSSLSAIRVVSSAYLRLLVFLPAILIQGCWFIQPSISHDVPCI